MIEGIFLSMEQILKMMCKDKIMKYFSEFKIINKYTKTHEF